MDGDGGARLATRIIMYAKWERTREAGKPAVEAERADGEKGDIRISCSGLAKVYAVIVMQNTLIVHVSFVRRGRLFPDPSRPPKLDTPADFTFTRASYYQRSPCPVCGGRRHNCACRRVIPKLPPREGGGSLPKTPFCYGDGLPVVKSKQ